MTSTPALNPIPGGENYDALTSPLTGEDSGGGDDHMPPLTLTLSLQARGATVLEEFAVAHSDDPVRHGCSLLAVGDEDDSLSLPVP